MRIKRNSVRLLLFSGVLLAAGFVGGTAKAQSNAAEGDVRGKFTLPYEVHWGKAVLPAGDYLLTFTPDMVPALISIQDQKSRRAVALESTAIREDNSDGQSALVIGSRGDQHVVESLRIEELGETFVYQRAPRQAVEEARKTRTVPVVVAEK
jgi:hypothetical protein